MPFPIHITFYQESLIFKWLETPPQIIKYLVEYFLNFTYYSISAEESDIFPGAAPR